MAHKKSGGSSSNGRDSIGRRLGLKTPGVSTNINCRAPTIFTARRRVRVV